MPAHIQRPEYATNKARAAQLRISKQPEVHDEQVSLLKTRPRITTFKKPIKPLCWWQSYSSLAIPAIEVYDMLGCELADISRIPIACY